MFALLISIICLLLLQLIWNLYNSRTFPQASQHVPAPSKQRLSVLIPARNEEATIGRLLESLIDQQAYIKEILVLDDHSNDQTATIVRQYAHKLPLTLLCGKELPPGWTGKNYACQQLGENATGEWLLFLDADVTLEAKGLQRLQRYLDGRFKMVSAFPRQRVHTFMEKMLVPFMLFLVICHLPIKQVQRSDDPKFAAAHGAFICIHKQSYQNAGRHAAIKSAIVDDMALMRLMKQAKSPVALLRGEQFASMRMYEKNAEVWLGFRKNIFSGTGNNIFLTLFICLLYSVLYIIPVVSAIIGIVNGDMQTVLMAAAAYALGVLINYHIAFQAGIQRWLCFLHPLACSFFILLAFDAIRIHWRGEGYEWKGRRYYQ
ncbi:glycosyltransferase [Terribacillus sp. DMT04]|uniref:glycosyltransferase n=1 Tax=Terribacillus sp. DMT04 TaxID=2850441 RepID=UPI001C2CB281|nr:glycosyltransferase [Terribacillus sp. DMT04]QXE00234.1 glycosyltransferase [Terribacillus sp. DMT04]